MRGGGVGAEDRLVSSGLMWKSFGGGGRQGAWSKKEDGVTEFGLGASYEGLPSRVIEWV
jgi:hypothetical protein